MRMAGESAIDHFDIKTMRPVHSHDPRGQPLLFPEVASFPCDFVIEFKQTSCLSGHRSFRNMRRMSVEVDAASQIETALDWRVNPSF